GSSAGSVGTSIGSSLGVVGCSVGSDGSVGSLGVSSPPRWVSHSSSPSTSATSRVSPIQPKKPCPGSPSWYRSPPMYHGAPIELIPDLSTELRSIGTPLTY